MYQNLRAEMARKNILYKDIANKLNISKSALSVTMKNGRLRFEQADIIRDSFFPDLDFTYLFKFEKDA